MDTCHAVLEAQVQEGVDLLCRGRPVGVEHTEGGILRRQVEQLVRTPPGDEDLRHRGTGPVMQQPEPAVPESVQMGEGLQRALLVIGAHRVHAGARRIHVSQVALHEHGRDLQRPQLREQLLGGRARTKIRSEQQRVDGALAGQPGEALQAVLGAGRGGLDVQACPVPVGR